MAPAPVLFYEWHEGHHHDPVPALADLLEMREDVTHSEDGPISWEPVTSRRTLGSIVGGPSPRWSQYRIVGYGTVTSVIYQNPDDHFAEDDCDEPPYWELGIQVTSRF